jgi:Fe-S-cluster containining protein
MSRDPRGSRLPLVRRVWEDGRAREFVHPADGSDPFEREPGAGEAEFQLPPTRQPPRIQGQLLGRRVEAADADRPIHLPLLRASCTAAGACCGLYHHIPSTGEDRKRALAVLAESWDRPFPVSQASYPAFDAYPDGPFNMLEFHGSCAFLGDDGLCRIHAAAGPQAKPQSCLAYPAVLVACGNEWHGSLRPECACLARTALEGQPLQDDPGSWVGLRSLLTTVWELPRFVRLEARTRGAGSAEAAVSQGGAVPGIARDEYLDWMRGTMAALKADGADPVDVLWGAAWALGQTAGDATPPRPWIERVASTMRRSARRASLTHGRESPYRTTLLWAAGLMDELERRDPATLPLSWPGDAAPRAASLAALLLHGHALLEHPALLPALAEMQRVFWLARAAWNLRPAEDADRRLESTSSWIFLWRNVEWDEPAAGSES